MPVFEDEFGFLGRQKNIREAQRAARLNAKPELSKNITKLMRQFPWLQPGTAFALANMQPDFLHSDRVVGERVAQIALADLNYQVQNTDRFGSLKPVQSPQERLLAWDKELKQQIRSHTQQQKLDEKAGAAFGDSEAAKTDSARTARFGSAPLSEIKAMRRTVRAALASGDPQTMSAVLGSLQQASAVQQDPYDIATRPGIVETLGKPVKAATNWLVENQRRAATAGQGQPAANPVIATQDPNAGLKASQAAGQVAKGVVRNTGVAFNAGQEGLAAAERGVVGLGQDFGKATGLDALTRSPTDGGYVGQPGTPAAGINPFPAQTATGIQGDPTGVAGLSPLTILEQTQAGQALGDLLHGRPVDTGSGWLPSYESQTAKAAAEASREWSPYLIDGHAWTVGRASADALGFEPDTTPFTIISGGIDAAQAWQLDPANFALSTLADANHARKTFDLTEAGDAGSRVARIEDAIAANPERSDEILKEFGVGVGQRAFLRGHNPVNWLYSRSGSAFVGAIAGESSPWKIYWALNGKVPIQSDTGQSVLKALSEATTEGDVRKILATELGTSIDRIPSYRQGLSLSPPPRLLSDMPRRVVDLEDPDQAANTIVQYLSLSKVPKAEQERIFNLFVAAQGRGDNYAAIDATYDAIEASLKSAGADPEEVATLLRRSRTEWDNASKYGVDAASGEDLPIRLETPGDQALDIPPEVAELTGPRWVSERFNTQLTLPDPRQLRRMVANKAWRGVVNSKGWGAGVAAASGYTDLWKTLVLIRGAWPVRVVGDEMFRMSATGQSPFMHPLSYLAQTIGNPNDSKFINWIERLGAKPGDDLLEVMRTERSARMADLLDEGLSPQDALKMVNGEMPIPENWGKKVAGALRRWETRVGKLKTDIAGAPWDLNDLYGEALTSRLIATNQGGRRSFLRYFDVVGRDSDHWAQGLADELARVYSERLTRRALSMSESEFLDALWTEDWGKYARQQMAAGRKAGEDGYAWVNVLHDRAWSDAYGKEVLRHLENIHGGDQRLIDAMRTGKFTFAENGQERTIDLIYGGHADPDAVEYLKGLREVGVGPDNVKVQRAYRLFKDQKGLDREALDSTVNAMFDALMTKPSNYLTRSPTFRQSYWDEVEQLIPSMDTKAQTRLRGALDAAGLDDAQKARITKILDESGSGSLSFGKADTILKRRALDYTRDLLYDLHKRSQFFDAARLIFPFGEAWKEILTTWAKIFTEHPNALRRTQQIIQGAREAEFDPVTGLPTGSGEGIIRHDPQTGQEVITYPISGWLSQQPGVRLPLLGMTVGGADMPLPVPLKGPAGSFNMILQGLPGIGPAASAPLSAFLPDKPQLDGVKNILFPYGEPEGSGLWDKLINQLKPSWERQAERGYADPRTDRMWGNTVFDVMNVLASTGEYDISGNLDATYEFQRLYRDATEKAKNLQGLRTLGAFTLPASPQPDFYVEDKTGNLVLLQTIRDEWVKKRNEFYDEGVPNASQKAFKWFINRYGVDNVFATQSKSQLKVVGLEPTKEMGRFERSHQDVVGAFPKTWGLFAPEGGTFDYNVYVSQIDRNWRDPYKPDEMGRIALSRLGDLAYQQLRNKLPEVPSREQQAWLDDVKDKLRIAYPGWTGAFSGNEDTAAEIAELQLASREGSPVANTELGKALRIYFQVRDEANNAAVSQTEKSSSARQSQETAAIRSWVFDAADEIAAEYPSFGRAWEQVLSYEWKDG